MIIANQDLFWAEAAAGDKHDWSIIGKTRKGVACPVPRLLEFTKFDLRWSDEVSNSHSCPVGGVENWGGRVKMPDGTDAPRGYPGWTGRVDWIVAGPKNGMAGTLVAVCSAKAHSAVVVNVLTLAQAVVVVCDSAKSTVAML